jgi:hypothetical protein
VPLWIIHLIEVERDSLREVAQSFVDGAALAGLIDFKALRYVPVFFLVYRGGQGATRGHSFSVRPNGPAVVAPSVLRRAVQRLLVADLQASVRERSNSRR